MHKSWLLCICALVALACSGGDEGDAPPTTETLQTPATPETTFGPNWPETRHAADAPAATLDLGNAATQSQVPQRAILLCNLDDDDDDGIRDTENATIDGDADADDLARIDIAALPNATQQRVTLLLAPTASSALDVDALRLFDAEGHARLGRGKGARWDLGPEQLSTLESSGLRLYAEGCSFRGRCELQLVVDAGVVDTVLLEVAPLLLAPPTRAFEALWIYRDDNSNTKALCAAFDLASGLVVQGNTDDRLLKVCLEGSLLRDFWLQDEVQWGYTETPFAYLPVAIHMPRGGLLKTWVRSLLAPDVGYVEPCAAPAYGAPEVSYAYGGNIEAGAAWGEGAPGCIVHGFSPTLGDDEEYANATLEPLRKFFTDNTAQPVIGIDPSWLYIGHVDEMISFAWSPRAPKEIKLLVASPGDGVWLLEDLATKGEKVPALVAQHYGGMVDSLADPTGFTWKDFLEARVTGRDTSLKLFNLELEKHVFGDPNDDDKPGVLEPLLSTLTKAAEEEGLEAPEVVKVPTFFYRVDSEDELALDAIALVPNMVNLVAIDGHLIFPDPLLESFRDALADSEALKAFDFAWIDVFDFLHLDVGGLHCATNTRHVAPEAPKWWEED